MLFQVKFRLCCGNMRKLYNVIGTCERTELFVAVVLGLSPLPDLVSTGVSSVALKLVSCLVPRDSFAFVAHVVGEVLCLAWFH